MLLHKSRHSGHTDPVSDYEIQLAVRPFLGVADEPRDWRIEVGLKSVFAVAGKSVTTGAVPIEVDLSPQSLDDIRILDRSAFDKSLNERLRREPSKDAFDLLLHYGKSQRMHIIRDCVAERSGFELPVPIFEQSVGNIRRRFSPLRDERHCD